MKIKEQILFISNNHNRVNTIETILTNNGYSLIITNNYTDSCNILNENEQLKLIIVDSATDVISNIDLCINIKKLYSKLPIILLLKSYSYENIKNAIKAGADTYIKYSFLEIEILNKIKYIHHNNIESNNIKRRLYNHNQYRAIMKQKHAEEKYRMLFKQYPDSIFILDKNTVIDCNPAAINMFGYKNEEEFFCLNPSEFSPEFQPDGQYSYDKASLYIEAALKDKPQRFEWVHTKRNKTNFYTEVLLTPISYGNDTILHATVRDISKRKLYEEEIERSKVNIENAHNHAIYMLALASENDDRGTGNHIKRIRSLTKELALEIGLDNEIAEKIALSSLLHDLGKIGISDKILHKPGKLSTEEFEIIKKHTEIGANIIGNNDAWFEKARNIALYHHEKWNGEGYPTGIKGKEIPLEARIVAIVDVFDALISKRPYKEPWPLKKAVNEIINNSGKHFDPGIVKAFITLYNQGILDKYYNI